MAYIVAAVSVSIFTISSSVRRGTPARVRFVRRCVVVPRVPSGFGVDTFIPMYPSAPRSVTRTMGVTLLPVAVGAGGVPGIVSVSMAVSVW